MASKKDKLIEEAQKLALKGPVDKAVKAYEQLVAMEPGVLNHRQRLADLLLKAGRADDARAAYEVIGKNFTSSGFYLKAIAIYTKLQSIFPGDIQISLTLAGLNEKHGLTANALAEYKKVYDHHEKAGEAEEALGVLEMMQNVDSQNVNIRQKLAEAYFNAGRKDESYTVYSKLATLLQERGDASGFAKLNARIQQLFPQKSEFALEVLSEQVASGNAASAVAGLQAQLRINPNEKRLWELIVEAYKQLGETNKVKVAYQHYLKFFPDEIKARLGLLQCNAAERDVKGTLALLDQSEKELYAGAYLSELEAVYRILDEVDPINLRVMEGLRGVCEALGKFDDAAAVEARINSLKNITSGKVSKPQKETKPAAKEPESAESEPDYFSGQASEEPEFGEISFGDIELEQESGAVHESPFAEPGGVLPESTEEEFEIEVEVEEEEAEEEQQEFISFLDETPEPEPVEDWLDTAAKFLDSLATKAGKVKFGEGLDSDDAQSHYDLGLAFMEMGLFDESIKEFRNAAADEGRRFACFIFQGMCLREKGDPENAEKVLRLLVNPALPLEDLCTAKYELALTCHRLERNDEYVSLLTEIDKADRNFRDVHARLAAASDDKGLLDFTEDDLQALDFK